jgi:ankyrin repeat protein
MMESGRIQDATEYLARYPEIVVEAEAQSLPIVGFAARNVDGMSLIMQLISLGAKVRFKDRMLSPLEMVLGSSSLMHSSLVPNLALLVELGADPNALTSTYLRPLQLAVLRDRPNFVSVLLDAGADPYLCDEDFPEENCIATAKRLGNEAARILLEATSN